MTAATTRRARPTLESLEDRLVPSAVAGLLFDDANADGLRQPAEAALAGRTVFLDADRDGTLDSGEIGATTADDGSFRFDGLAAGRYLVAQLPPAGWRGTAPLLAAAIDAVPDGGALIGMHRFRADPRFDDVDGRGVSVAVIDSGLAPHRFFPAGSVVAQYDFVDDDEDATDGLGHGTHVSSVIASRDRTAPGMAPGVGVVALRVLDDEGGGDFGNVERALRWVIDHGAEYNVVAVNLSLSDGGSYDSPLALYELGDELEELDALGITVIAAAGNDYAPDVEPGLAYPAIDPHVLAVGAVWDRNQGGPWNWQDGARDVTTGPDRLVSFSQRLDGVGQVFAPGTRITGATPDGGTADQFGTSTATAVVSGAVALAQQLARDRLGHFLSPEELRSLIRDTGVVITDGDDENDNVTNTGHTFSRIDVMALCEAILARGTVSPGISVTTRDVSVGADQTIDVSLGTFRDGIVSGVAFADDDGDGVRDAGDGPAIGRLVFADRDNDGRRDPGEPFGWTDSQGRFSLTGLGPGVVRIRQEVSADVAQTTPVLSLTVTSGLTRADLSLGARSTKPNAAPTLAADGPTTNIDEDERRPAGFTVASALAGSFGDVDAGALRGLAVVETVGNGRWQFSLDAGRSWSDVGSVSLTRALLLREQDVLRFIPAADATGTASVRYHAWDRTAGMLGYRPDLTTLRGGRGAFSIASAMARVVVRPINDAPVILTPGRFTPVAAGSTPPGDLVSAMLGTSVRDPDAGAVIGLAILGATGRGTWQYSRDGGATWLNLGTVSAGRARLLAATDRVRFVPTGPQRGTAALSYRAWDGTTGSAGDVVDLSLAVAVGGATAFSRYSTTATLSVA